MERECLFSCLFYLIESAEGGSTTPPKSLTELKVLPMPEIQSIWSGNFSESWDGLGEVRIGSQ